MADAPSKQEKWWSSDGMSTKHDSLVPGVNDVGNRRPAKSKVKGGKTRTVKASVPIQQPVMVETTDSHGKTTSSGLMSSDISTIGTDISTLHSRAVTLKDLCADDKKRIANLIKELAKVGEEKENAEQNLSEERQHYQQQIMALVHQQEAILKEREDVQNRLLDYQSYIVKLQQQQQLHQLLQHQERNRQHDHHQKNHPQSQQQLPYGEVKGEGNVKHSLNRHERHQYPQRDNSDEDGESDGEKEGPALEEPSVHIYLNESADQSADADELSTEVNPSQTMIDNKSRPLPHRPFTALIDKQLCEQRKKAEKMVGDDNGNKTNPKHVTDRDDCNAQMEEKYRKKGERNGNELRLTKGSQARRLEEQGDRLGTRGKNNFSELQDLPDGAAVSPEKAEIFTRFMDSQKRGRPPGERVYGQVGEEMEQRRGRRKDEEEMEAKGRKRKSGKKHKSSRPPACLGGFYPPIMSSTQKSSEIGDYMSNVDSTITSDRNVNDKNLGEDKIRTGGRAGIHGNVPDVDAHWDRKVIIENKSENNSNHIHRKNDGNSDDMAERKEVEDFETNGRYNSNNNGSNRRLMKSRVDFMDSDMGGGDGGEIGVDADFLCYYKKLSASERKQELLKQRATLLEEQNKLKQLLTHHQQQHLKRQQVLENQVPEDNIKAEPEKNAKTDRRRKEQILHARNNRIKDPLSGGIRDGELNSDTQSDVIVSGHGLKNGRPVKNYPGQNLGDRDVVNAERRSQLKMPRGGIEEEEGVMLRGRDGDECVTYNHPKHGGTKTGDQLVKRLDYSLGSDSEEDVRQSPSNLDKKFVMSPNNNGDAFSATSPSFGAVRSLPSGVKSGTKMAVSPLPAVMDAGTSISFATIPGHREVSPDNRKIGMTQTDGMSSKLTNQRKGDRHHSKPRFSESPGDKTLAVLKIINSLPDERTHTFNSASSRTTAALLPTSNSNLKKTTSNVLKNNRNPKLKDTNVSSRKNLFSQRNLLKSMDSDVNAINRITLNKPGTTKNLQGGNSNNEFGKRLQFSGLDTANTGRRTVGAGLGVDSELDVFDRVGWKEERMDGYRKIISGKNHNDDNEEDDDDTFYDYDDKDDSNIDGIVEDLLLFSSDIDDIGADDDVDVEDDSDDTVKNDDDESEKEEAWDYVMRSLNGIPKVERDPGFDGLKRIERGQRLFQGRHLSDDNANDDDDSLYNDDDGRDPYQEMREDVEESEESAILEDIFFVTH